MGAPKWALNYHGEPQAHQTARLLGAVCERVFLSVRPGPPDAGLPDLPTIPDAVAVRGPSAGILSAMAAYPGAAWLVAACDLPLLDAPTLAALVAGRDPDRLATTYRSSSDGLPEPLCTVWEPHAREPLLAAATAGAPCPRRFLAGADAALLDLARPHALDNANTPGDQAAARAALSARHGPMEKRIRLVHYAVFRDARGRDGETVTTHAETPRDLFDELGFGAACPSPAAWIRVAVNDDFATWDARLTDGDTVVFIAPTAGG
jgi:molybdopterin-guanine dinucleotide biosynthesis protein A